MFYMTIIWFIVSVPLRTRSFFSNSRINSLPHRLPQVSHPDCLQKTIGSAPHLRIYICKVSYFPLACHGRSVPRRGRHESPIGAPPFRVTVRCGSVALVLTAGAKRNGLQPSAWPLTVSLTHAFMRLVRTVRRPTSYEAAMNLVHRFSYVNRGSL